MLLISTLRSLSHSLKCSFLPKSPQNLITVATFFIVHHPKSSINSEARLLTHTKSHDNSLLAHCPTIPFITRPFSASLIWCQPLVSTTQNHSPDLSMEPSPFLLPPSGTLSLNTSLSVHTYWHSNHISKHAFLQLPSIASFPLTIKLHKLKLEN